MRLPRRFQLPAVLCPCILLLGPDAAPAAQGEEERAGIQDLAYGEVLFHFFQEDYFSALVRLAAAQARDELPSHRDEAELLLGGLYLSYGQHHRAAEIFERLLEQSVAPELHDRAWYFLAKIWYQRGYLTESEAALARIKGALPEEIGPEHRLLQAQVRMQQGRFEEALALLEAWRRPDERWLGYAKYNIGVSLVRLGRVEEGAAVLAELGQLESQDPEAQSLRDKANVALGYAWLQAGRPLEAKPSLQRVRLNGPFSNKALLGTGWSDAELENYQAALVPWMELADRSLLDPAVQESLLAIPYAFARLGASKQAADHYSQAIDAFDSEMARLDLAIAAVRDGQLLRNLLSAPTEDASGWYWQLDGVPESAESRYLYELMATHRFQEGLKNYRDLQYLQRNLNSWGESLIAFDDILDTRERAYRERLPVVLDSLDRMDLDALEMRRVALESRLSAIERAEDYAALATPAEQALWRRLSEMESKLRLLPQGGQASAIRDKHRFLKGLLSWDLQRDYKARLWHERKSLRELDRQLKTARRTYHEVDRARREWPDKFADLTGRIDALAPRVQGLAERVNEAVARQERFLQGIAIEELQARRERLGTYVVQARFALASVYDRAAAQASTLGDREAEATQ